MEEAYREDHSAGPITLVTDDIADASPFNSLRFEGSALVIAKKMPVRNFGGSRGTQQEERSGGGRGGQRQG